MAAAHIRHRVEALAPPRAARLVGRSPRARQRTRRVGGAVAVLVGLVVFGPFMVGATTAVWLLVVRCRPIVRSRREASAAIAVLPDALELFVLMVHAGLTPRQAIELLAHRAPLPVRHGFVSVLDRLDRGEPLADALRALPDRLGPSTLVLADLIGTADRYGLPLAPVLGQLADQARADRRRADDANARALPVKLAFPLVVCTLPSFVLLAIVPAVMAALSSLQGTSW